MDYQKIHDTIISRAADYTYNPEIHDKHHVIPSCLSPIIETVESSQGTGEYYEQTMLR